MFLTFHPTFHRMSPLLGIPNQISSSTQRYLKTAMLNHITYGPVACNLFRSQAKKPLTSEN